MEQWLKCQFMQPYINQKFKGQVSQINSNGFTVRLDELHIEGFVDTRLLKEKYSFDPMRLRLKSKDIQIELDQSIEVVVSEVDCKQKNIRFELVKKPPRVTALTKVIQPIILLKTTTKLPLNNEEKSLQG
jgi:ribonuclease R